MKKLKIALTGGPSGGKTTLIEALQKDMSSTLAVVPEAASILYRGGFPRRPTIEGRKHAQRAICYTQRELEDLITAESKLDVIVCDRGSLDSIAYWPGNDAVDFFQSLQTHREAELQRYDWVLHLDTADVDTFDANNPIRTESFLEAVELNAKIKEAWKGHPQRVVIPHEEEFLLKILRAKNAIEMIMEGKSFSEIQKALNFQAEHE
jgi:nicotinamide riboside kinase